MDGVCGESRFFGFKDDHARLTRLIWHRIDVDGEIVGDSEEEGPMVCRPFAGVVWLVQYIFVGHKMDASDRRVEVIEDKLAFPPVVVIENVGFEGHSWLERWLEGGYPRISSRFHGLKERRPADQRYRRPRLVRKHID